MLKTLAISISVAIFLFLGALSAVASQTLFEDNFSGTALDSSLWNTGQATSGSRWCSSTIPAHHSNPGNWQDVSSEPCHGFMQTGTYGSILTTGGVASFQAGYSRAFPYIWAGPPSRISPFPESGDFTLEIRMKYDELGGHGDGIQVLYDEDTDPVGDNPPIPTGSWVFGIWAGYNGLKVSSIAGQTAISNPYIYHTYRLEFSGGAYSLYVDNVLRQGPVANSRIPNTIWIGNPVFTYWASLNWTDFTVDYIKVSVPTVQVGIDIQPGSDTNCINNDGQGVIPVAVWGTDMLDVRDIDAASLSLEGMSIKTAGKNKSKLLAHYEDINGDGYEDLVVQFQDSLGALSPDMTSAKLTGNLFDGTGIEGTDIICLVP